MTTSARHRTSATVLRYVLVVLLLALAGLLAVPGADPSATAASGTTSAAGHHVTVPAADRVVAAVGQHSDHGTPHGAEALGLLCLCALLVTGIVLAGRGVTTYRVALRAVATVRGRWLGTRSYPHAAGPDLALLGISRT